METKIDERQVLIAVLDQDRGLLRERPGLLILAEKGYLSREPDTYLTDHGVHLLRPSYRNRTPHPLKPVRQLVQSVNATLNLTAAI
ncbi:hypothetical protein ACIRDW_29020 [Amycolatopsis thermoflava]|uniref:hypothetical protein n=1 Tax=Amycolatopsis thermoflava TaxID=84480 RepID=UPI00364C3ECA